MTSETQAFIEKNTLPSLDAKLSELMAKKAALTEESSRLQGIHLSLQKRNEEICQLLDKESAELDKKILEHQELFEKTKEECAQQIKDVQEELKTDFAQANKILVENRKKYNHLRFNLAEKKEVDETRKSMIDQEAKLKQELNDLTKELKEKLDSFSIENYNRQYVFKAEANQRLQQQIEEAKVAIEKERLDTLKDAGRESKILTKKVATVQKAVVNLRDNYNRLLEEANELEMQMMEAKLVTQLANTEANKQKIQQLQEKKDQIEEMKLKARTKPEADNRRKATQHMNLMKKKKNELSGFIKLNQLKQKEMNQLRALASTIVEQRNTMMAFMNETITMLRKQIASSVDQKHLTFRTSELILCHVNAEDQPELTTMLQNPGDITSNPQEQLRFFEVLYSRFTGIPQPRKVEEVV